MKAKMKPARAGVQTPRSFSRKVTIGYRYLLYRPAGSGRSTRRWPLILFLHGAGERGDDLDVVKKHGPPKLAGSRRDFPFIVVSPQCPTGTWWSTQALQALLDHVTATLPVDPSRVYLTGLSMGGYGTWHLACECPERFAAIAPICGGGHPVLAGQLKNVPVWAFHGALDDVVPLRESQAMVEGVRKAGGKARLTVYPKAGHDSWSATYENPEFYKWLLAHRRQVPRPRNRA